MLRFLSELGLLGTAAQDPLIDLVGAQLDGVDLTPDNLPKADFSHISLAGAHLRRANPMPHRLRRLRVGLRNQWG